MQYKGKYIVYDVETADKENSYVCSICLAIVNNGEIGVTTYSLVKPNCEFGEYNTKVNGITKEMVNNAPTFSEIWDKIHLAFENFIMVAHNAHFDLNVINKEIIRNNIQIENIRYVDTLQVARKCLNLEHYSLSDVCKALNVELENHHCALDDCVATAKVLIKLLDEYNVNLVDFVKSFNISNEFKRLNDLSENQKNKDLCFQYPKINFFSECPQSIDLKDATVCLSGNFNSMSKNQLSGLLEGKGVLVKSSVTKSLKYLVVGEQGSKDWTYGSFGTKVEKALKFNKKGSNILIIGENDFLKCANIVL